jgi:hypothetical protein
VILVKRKTKKDDAPEGVDLAVVAHHAQGLRAVPGGEGVGGEARVDQGHVRHEVGVLSGFVLGMWGRKGGNAGWGVKGEGATSKPSDSKGHTRTRAGTVQSNHHHNQSFSQTQVRTHTSKKPHTHTHTHVDDTERHAPGGPHSSHRAAPG